MSRRWYLQRIAAPVVNKGGGVVLMPPRLLFKPATLPPGSATGTDTGAIAWARERAADRDGAARSSNGDLRGQSMNSDFGGPMPARSAPRDRLAAEREAQIAASAPAESLQVGVMQIDRPDYPVDTSKLSLSAHGIGPKDQTGAIDLMKPSPNQSAATGQPISQSRFQSTAEIAHGGTSPQLAPEPRKLQAASREGTTAPGPSAVLSSGSRAAGGDSAKQPAGSRELETPSHDLINARAASPRKAAAPHDSRLETGVPGPPWRDAGPAVKEPARRGSIQLIPPPIVPQIGSKRRAANQTGETGAGVHIGSLEIHVVAPSTPTPPSSPQAWSVLRPQAKPGAVRLARGFRSFGLVQS
jgi:hypothetical protein